MFVRCRFSYLIFFARFAECVAFRPDLRCLGYHPILRTIYRAAPAFLFALSLDIRTAILLVVGITIIQLGESYLVSPLVMNKVLHIRLLCSW